MGWPYFRDRGIACGRRHLGRSCRRRFCSPTWRATIARRFVGSAQFTGLPGIVIPSIAPGWGIPLRFRLGGAGGGCQHPLPLVGKAAGSVCPLPGRPAHLQCQGAAGRQDHPNRGRASRGPASDRPGGGRGGVAGAARWNVEVIGAEAARTGSQGRIAMGRGGGKARVPGRSVEVVGAEAA